MSLRRLLLLLLSLSLTWVGCDTDPTPPDSGTPVGTDGGGRDGSMPDDPDGGRLDGSTPDGSDGGSPDGSTPDGSDGGSPDGSTPDDPTAVTVTRVLRYHSAAGMETVADTSAPAELFIPEGTSFRRIEGTVTDTGSYRFTGIPVATTYYLKLGINYVVTDSRAVDLSEDFLGRPDAGLASESGYAAVRFDVSGLEPVTFERPTPFVIFEFISDTVDFLGYPYTDPDLSPGQSTYAGEGGMNSASSGFPLFSAERGDRAWVNQFAPRDAGTLSNGVALTYETVVRSLPLPPFSHDGSAPIEVRGTFQPAPMTDISLDWRLSAFAAYAQAAHPGATSGTSSFDVFPAAHGLEYGWVGASGELLTLSTPRGTTEDLVLPLSYGNPSPSTWGVVGRSTHTFRYLTRLTNGAAVTLGSSMNIQDGMAALVAGAIVPRLSPPRGLAINGLDAYVSQRVEGSNPVVSWTPPELGTPSLYTLTLLRFDPPSGGGTQPRLVTVARFYLPGAARSVQLPADLLQPSKDHCLRLTASSSPGVDLSSAPLVIGSRVPLHDATTVSAILTMGEAAPVSPLHDVTRQASTRLP